MGSCRGGLFNVHEGGPNLQPGMPVACSQGRHEVGRGAWAQAGLGQGGGAREQRGLQAAVVAPPRSHFAANAPSVLCSTA
jgi:hypothetical protein